MRPVFLRHVHENLVSDLAYELKGSIGLNSYFLIPAWAIQDEGPKEANSP